MEIKKYNRVIRHITGPTLLDLTLNQLAGIDPVDDKMIDSLCKRGYDCAKKEKSRRIQNKVWSIKKPV